MPDSDAHQGSRSPEPLTATGEIRLALGTERRLVALAVTVISLVAFEVLAVATAMPTVVASLGGQSFYAVAMGVPLATQLITTAIAGPWTDARGALPVLATGLGLLSVGLVACTAAPDILLFSLGRAVQGLGGGLCIVPLYVLISGYVQPARQPAAFAWFAAAWVVPSLIGPALAGLLVEQVTWRAVFGMVPVALLVVGPVLLRSVASLPRLREPTPLRLLGTVPVLAAATGAALLALQYLTGAAERLSPGHAVVLMVAGVVAALLLVRPLLPVGTLHLRLGAPATVAYRGLLNVAFVGTETYLPLLLQTVHRWSPTQAGLVLTATSVTWAAASWVQGRIGDHHTRVRIPMIGTALVALGVALTVPAASPEVPGIVVLVAWLVAGCGLGYVYPATSVHALALTPPAEHGRTSAALQLADSMGSALGVALVGTMFAVAGGMAGSGFLAAFGMMAVLAVSLPATVPRLDVRRTP